MKERVDSRGPLNSTQYQFDNAGFSPQNLEDTIVILINELFDAEIRAVSSLDFKEDTDTAEPLIVVESKTLELSRRERGVKEISYGVTKAGEGPQDNAIRSEQAATGTMNINLVARSARGTTRYSYEVLEFFQELGYFMGELIGVLAFYPERLIAPRKIEDNEHLWQSTIQCSYKVSRSWATERLAPKLKSFGLKGLVNDSDAV